MNEDDLRLRLGRIRGRGARKGALGEILAAAQRAGGLAGAPRGGGRFGRGRAASLQAGHHPAQRGAVIKARVVRQAGGRGRLGAHLAYLQRDGVTADGARGVLFDAHGQPADAESFAARCAGDRHHFRFIVSPDDADRLADLSAFTRDLMAQAQADLATGLDWVAVAHWNTGHPHVHVLVRGRQDDGADLVISRDYISRGLRARAGALVDLELGPPGPEDLARRWRLQITADRWTALDRALEAAADPDRVIDLRPRPDWPPTAFDLARTARARRLAQMGLAQEVRPGGYRLDPTAEATLKALSLRQDVIARLHRAMGGQTPDPGRLAPNEPAAAGLVARLLDRGLHDELQGSAYAVLEGLDGRLRHLPLGDLASHVDAPLGGLVMVRQAAGAAPRLQVLSDLSVADQVTARGATWLDRQLLAAAPLALGQVGLGAEVEAALGARAAHLAARGLGRQTAGRFHAAPGLLARLEAEDLALARTRLTAATGLAAAGSGAMVQGVYRRRLDLASGRFAVIDDGQSFSLVPWRPALEPWRGREVRLARAMGPGWRLEPLSRGLSR